MTPTAIRQIVARLNAALKGANISKSRVHEVGEFLGNYVLLKSVTAITKKIPNPKTQRHETQQVAVTPVKAIHASVDAGGSLVVNADGHGHEIARIYKGADGIYYKHFANEWYEWNGREWV